MKEESKNETLELIDVREEIIKDLNVEVARLKQQVMDKECEMMQMEKYFKHAYYMLVLEAMICMSIIAILCTYLLTTK
jgi:hypothetical protein